MCLHLLFYKCFGIYMLSFFAFCEGHLINVYNSCASKKQTNNKKLKRQNNKKNP